MTKILAAPTALPTFDVLPVHQFVLDGYGCDVSRCDDLAAVWNFMDSLPDELGLGKTTVPLLIPYYNGLVPDDCGITGIAYTELGHVTLHTFSKKKTLFLDVTSPVNFDIDHAKKRVNDTFKITWSENGSPDRDANPSVLPDMAAGAFGPHLTIDIADYDVESFDMQTLYKTLHNLPDQVDMTRIMTPNVIQYNLADGEPCMSGIVLIAESHISFHLMPERRKGYVDLFSCKPFDVNKTLQLVRKAAGIKRDVVNMTSRGLHFPREH